MNSPLFRYDVFISYKSQQESWAKRLAATLRNFGLNVWRDHDAGDGIRVSERWSTEIENGIRDSRYMIVLWSKLVLENAASHVHEEVRLMKQLKEADATGQRKFIPINLDGTPLNNYTALEHYQADVGFQDLYQEAKDGGAEDISAIDWYSSIKALIDVLGLKDIMEVRFVVAAMNQTQARELLEKPEQYAEDLDSFNLMKEMMAKTSLFTPDRYGASPNDWRPFPQIISPSKLVPFAQPDATISIRNLIDSLDAAKRKWALENGQYSKWALVSYSDDMASSEIDVRNNAREAVQRGPYIVIIDPVSLMHRQVYRRIISDNALTNHHEAFVIGVAPFVSTMHNDLYETTRKIEAQMEQFLVNAYYRFKQYYEPINRACVMNIEQEFQFMRWLHIGADTIITANKTPPARFARQDRTRSLQEKFGKPPGPDILNMGR